MVVLSFMGIKIIMQILLIGALAVLLSFTESYSQIIKPTFENLSVKDGLPENSVLSILQDHLGFMWFGTQNGLVRYDGYKMKVYHHIPGDSLSLSEDRVSALYEDRSGNLWIGTTVGIDCFNRATEKFRCFNIPADSLSTTSTSVTFIYEDNQRNLWIGTTSGLYLFDLSAYRFNTIHFRDYIYPSEIYNQISTLIKKKRRIQGILNVSNSLNIQKSFILKQKTPVLIVMMGEDGRDYGYIKDSKGRIINNYNYEYSCHAGGSKENRIQIIVDTLAEGNYTLNYKSNFNYSYQDGFTKKTGYFRTTIGKAPTFPEYWGIQIFDLSDNNSGIKKILKEKTAVLNRAEVFSIVEDSSAGKLFIGSICQGLWELDSDKKAIVRSNTSYNNISYDDIGSFRSFCKSINGSIWIASTTGVLNFEPLHDKWKYFTSAPVNEDLSGKRFTTIIEDKYGTVWAGSFLNSLFYLDFRAGQLSQIDITMYPQRYRFFYVLTSYVDRSGVIWVGTWSTGLEKWDRKKTRIIKYDLNQLARELKFDFDVSSLLKDDSGIIWLGTYTGLISYNRKSGEYQHFRHDPLDPYSISNDDIRYLFKDRSDPEILWIATCSGLNKFNIRTNKFTRYKIKDGSYTESDLNYLRFIYEDRAGTFWVCTNIGVYWFNKYSGTFTRTKLESMTERGNNLNYESIHTMYEDKQNNLWAYVIGGGLIRIYPSEKKWKVYWSFPNGDYYIAAPAFCEDTKNNFWIGDYASGVHYFDRNKETSVNYSPEAGLVNKTIYCMTADKKDNLWILSEDGELTRFNPQTGKHKTFTTEDGLVELKFINFNVLFNDSGGEILIGGTNGFASFYPDSLKDDPTPPGVVIDRISLFNRPDENIDYKGFISEIKKITLPYDQNDLHFEYTGLHYGEPARNQYKYILEGFDDKWIDAGNQRTATYTNLSPGKYIFRVKASNRDAVWNQSGTSLTIIINPPFWATALAYLFYTVVFLSLLYFIWMQQLRRIRAKQEFEMNRFEAQKLHEIDEIKSRFFTNISHEFRTPLTLIIGPVKEMIEKLSSGRMKDDLVIVHRNANKLLLLVNQLLEISKLESGTMRLQTKLLNIIPLLKALVLSFTSLAERKKIMMKFNFSENQIMVYLDKEKFEKIVNNILSNAFKFTPEGGIIGINAGRDDKYVNISFSDTGPGIPKEKIPKIFDRFYQVDGSHTREQEGTGIGLSLTKELLELHKGKIEVNSEDGKGTTFIISIPLGKDHLKPENICAEETDNEGEFSKMAVSGTSEIPNEKKNRQAEDKLEILEKESKPLLLIVEDNDDVRHYIKDKLNTDYRIEEAFDGGAGWQKCVEQIPDLVISDVMMPKMDGFEFCEKLKTAESTSHIPVILLTAKASKNDKIVGYENGADDYITKPFEPEELKARIKNLIEQRKRVHEHFQKDGFYEINKVQITSADKRFLLKALEIINSNIADASFTVEDLAANLYMSYSLLHKKMVSLTGEPPVGFVRRIRLKRAAELIEKKFGNLSQIALEVGFNNPAYFSECFKKQFGVSPSQFRTQNSRINN